MDNWPLWAQITTVVLLLGISAFFSISETSMMALNRHRLKHLARAGHRGAQYTQQLLKRTDRLLSVILIGNNLINTVVPVLTTALAMYYFGNSATVLSAATASIAFLIIVLCEIAPKVVGARHPERIALAASYILRPLVWLAQPLVWFVNLFVRALFKLLRIRVDDEQNTRLSDEELRGLILESGHFIPRKHRSILLNLFNLKNITVDDVMTPKSRMEILDLSRPIKEVIEQLETCYHNKLPVCEEDHETIIGVLHIRKTLSLLGSNENPTHDDFRALLTPVYYVPSGTFVFRQLQYFQENRQRIGFIVNEYGEVQGLVTVEDIIEEMIGEFTTSHAGLKQTGNWDTQGHYIADGSTLLRDLNRQLNLTLPLTGPKTLNGLLLESLQEIPDASVSVKIGNCAMDILHIDNQAIKTVRIYRPTEQIQEEE